MLNNFDYLNKFTDAYSFVENIINEGLSEDTKVKIATKVSKSVEQLLEDPKFFKTRSEGDINKTRKEISEKVFIKKYHQADLYKQWVLNYGLIILCSVFDEYLYDFVKEVLASNSEYTSWYSKEEILAKFKHENIKGKVNILTKRLKISEAEFFNFNMFRVDIQKTYEGYGFDNIYKVYQQRDKAAHTIRFAVTSLEELQRIRDLMEKIVWVSSINIGPKFKVENQFVSLYLKHI